MQIRSLVVGKRPMWFSVEHGLLEQIEFFATLRFWPAGGKHIALFLIEFEETPPPGVLAAHNISSSVIGSYVYLDAPALSEQFRQTITLPPAKVRRIGIRSWNHEEPILLENMTVTALGAEVSSEYAVSEDVFPDDFEDFRMQAGPGALALSLMNGDPACNAHCHAICQHWYETMDDVARRARHDTDVGRTNCSFDPGKLDCIPVTIFKGRPAMLRIPRSREDYLARIGDKARNMIRKAQRQGYAYRKVNPDDHLDEVLAIRTSNPERQGKPIPDYYKIRPTQMIGEPFRKGCALHNEDFFGVFKDDKLVAYTTIFFYGELGQVNHILGHADHLQEGIMNLLASEMVREIIEHRPWVRAINYLYPHFATANAGIGLFKRSIGFLPERLVITQDQGQLAPYFPNPDTGPISRPAEAPSEKKALRSMTSKAVKASVAMHNFIHLAVAKDREQALDATLRYLQEISPALEILCRDSADALDQADFRPSLVHAIVFENIALTDFQDFLSSRIKSFRKILPKDSMLVFNFKRVIEHDQSGKGAILSRLISWTYKARMKEINRALREYFMQRFKSIDLSVDDVRAGFKGSDYVVAGLVDYEVGELHRDFDSWLILRKIR